MRSQFVPKEMEQRCTKCNYKLGEGYFTGCRDKPESDVLSLMTILSLKAEGRGQASTPSASVCGDTPFRIVKDFNRNPVCSSDPISVVS
jgi:hypothetical protein